MALLRLRGEESLASQKFLFSLLVRSQRVAGFLTCKLGKQWRFSAGGKKLAIPPPVDGHRNNLGRVLPKQPLHYVQRLLGRDTFDSQEREARRQAFAPRRIREAQVGPRSPVDSQSRLALGSSMMRQRIQKCVGSGIVSLLRL